MEKNIDLLLQGKTLVGKKDRDSRWVEVALVDELNPVATLRMDTPGFISNSPYFKSCTREEARFNLKELELEDKDAKKGIYLEKKIVKKIEVRSLEELIEYLKEEGMVLDKFIEIGKVEKW